MGGIYGESCCETNPTSAKTTTRGHVGQSHLAPASPSPETHSANAGPKRDKPTVTAATFQSRPLATAPTNQKTERAKGQKDHKTAHANNRTKDRSTHWPDDPTAQIAARPTGHNTDIARMSAMRPPRK